MNRFYYSKHLTNAVKLVLDFKEFNFQSSFDLRRKNVLQTFVPFCVLEWKKSIPKIENKLLAMGKLNDWKKKLLFLDKLEIFWNTKFCPRDFHEISLTSSLSQTEKYHWQVQRRKLYISTFVYNVKLFRLRSPFVI